MKRRAHAGFTLAELLIVVLSAIAFPVFSSQLNQTRLAVDIAHVRDMETHAGILTQTGSLTVGDVTITTGSSSGNIRAYCFMQDGILSDDLMYYLPVVTPKDTYLAQANGVDGDTHKVGDMLIMVIEKNGGFHVEWSKSI